MEFCPLDETTTFVTEHFADLAASMANNSVYHSVRPGQLVRVGQLAMKAPAFGTVQPHIVVVVGAGASNAACGLPTGAQVADLLRTEVRPRIVGVDGRGLVDEEIKKLALHFNLVEEDFETILLALSKFDRPYVVSRLQSIFGPRYYPWLGYELLAHFLKHRFIDAIVNFNFDELLDQAVLDELGEGSYHSIILDGDCAHKIGDWIDPVKHKFRLPIYLKPHGSVRQPSSLRFTRESYTSLPDGFVTIMRELFATNRPIYVLVLGHAMQSIEFNHVLRISAIDRLHENAMKFYFLEPSSDRLLRFSDRMASESYTTAFPERTIEIAMTLEILWTNIRQQFNLDEEPRGIERHKLVSKLFDVHRNTDSSRMAMGHSLGDWPHANYFKDRTLVELALSVAKAKGFASMEDLSYSRVGTYFRLHREQPPQDGQDHESRLKSLNDACEKLGLKSYGYGDSAVSLGASQDEKARTTVILEPGLFSAAAAMLAETTCGLIDSTIGPCTSDSDDVKEFTAALVAMYRGEEVEVLSGRTEDRSLSFENAVVLPTFTALKWRTEQLMSELNLEWDWMVCTAKSGEWLLKDTYVKYLTQDRKATMALVVSDTTYRSDLSSKYGNRILTPIRWLPWWLHNRNVTVFLHKERPKYAISFERRMRKTNIAPLFLDAASDVNYAWKSFVAYWLKADRFHQGERDDHITETDLREAELDLINNLRSQSEKSKK